MANAVAVVINRAASATSAVTLMTSWCRKVWRPKIRPRHDAGGRRRPAHWAGAWLNGSWIAHVAAGRSTASAAQGMDHRWTVGVDLLTQIGDVELDDVRLAAEVVIPHPVQDLCLAGTRRGLRIR